MNTYAELYGNIKKRSLKGDLDNNLITSKALADRTTIFGAVSNFTKEGDAMDNFLGNHKSSLANTELYGAASRVASAFDNSEIGMTMPTL